MKTEYVRIYSEEELRHKVQQTSAMLKAMNKKIADDPKFCDINALTAMDVQYMTTRFIVTESVLVDEHDYIYNPCCLYVEREVEDDYSDELHAPDSIHNELVSLQFLYDSIQKFLLRDRYIEQSKYINEYSLVLEIATDIYPHLDHSDPSEHMKFVNILEDLNFCYITDTEWNEVLLEDVMSNDLSKQVKEADTLDKLITTLDLVAD